MAIADTDPRLRGFYDNGTNTPGYRQGILIPIGNNRGVWTFGMTLTVTLSGVTVPDTCIQVGPNASVQTNGIDPNISYLLEPITFANDPYRCSSVRTSSTVVIDGSYNYHASSPACGGTSTAVNEVRVGALLHHSRPAYATTKMLLYMFEASNLFGVFAAEFAPEELADGMVLTNEFNAPGDTLPIPELTDVVAGGHGGTATITFNCPSP